MVDAKRQHESKRINVIITGSIRSRLETFQVFEEISRLISKGDVSRAVVAAWNDEIRDHKSLFHELIRRGIEVIEVQRNGNSSFEAQLIPFYSALTTFEDEDFVVRARTDKCYPILISFLKHKNLLLQRSQEISEGSLFSSKIVVPAISLTEPFAHGDFLFMAKARDLRKLCHLDSYYDLFGNNPNAETRWFSRPYITAYPDIRMLMENFSNNRLAFALSAYFSPDKPDSYLPEMPKSLARILGKYLYLCSRDFLLINSYELPEHYSSLSAFSWVDRSSWRWGPRVFVNSQRYLDMIFRGDDNTFIGEQVNLASKSDLSLCTIDMSDIAEIGSFVEKCLSNAPTKYRLKDCIFRDLSKSKDEAKPLAHSGYDLFLETCESIDSKFDRKQVSAAVELLIREAIDGTNKAFGNMESYVTECRASAQKIIAVLDRDCKLDDNYQLYILPALFYEASLVFGWDPQAGDWLARRLLAGELSEKFAAITRWGLTSRHWLLPPDTLYLASLLAERGIGGPIDAKLAADLRESAIRGGHVLE